MSSNNLAGHVGREISKEIAGETWTFARWDRQVWVDFAAWGKSFLPDPLEVAMRNMDQIVLKDAEAMRELQRRDEAEEKKARETGRPAVLMLPKYKQMAEYIVDKALEKAASYLSFNSPEMRSLINSAPGSAQVLFLLLKPHHPEISESQAFDLMQQMSPADIQEVFEVTAGRNGGAPKNESHRAA